MFLRNSISSIWKSKEMSSEVKRGQNAGNIECLRPGGGASKNRVAQCHRHGRNELADFARPENFCV